MGSGMPSPFIVFGLCAISFRLIYSYGSFEVERLGFFDLVLLGLASLRLIHLITYTSALSWHPHRADRRACYPARPLRPRCHHGYEAYHPAQYPFR